MLKAKKLCYKFLIGPILVLIPVIIYIYVKGYYDYNDGVLWRAFEDFVNNEQLILINMGVVAVSYILGAMGVQIPHYEMGIDTEITPVKIGLLILGILFMICSVKIHTTVTSLFRRGILKNTYWSDPIFDAIYSIVNMTIFLLCNIVTGAIGNSSMPYLWIFVFCIFFVLFILSEKQHVGRFRSKYEKPTAPGFFFESVNIVKDLASELVKSFSMILFILTWHGIALIGEVNADVGGAEAILRIIGAFGGLYCCIETIADDIETTFTRRIVFFVIAFAMYALFARVI